MLRHTPCICTGSWCSCSDDMSGGCSATPESQRTIGDRAGAEGSLGAGTSFPSAATCLPCHGGGMPTVWNHFSAETGKAGSLPLRSKKTWKRKRVKERKLSVDFVREKKKEFHFRWICYLNNSHIFVNFPRLSPFSPFFSYSLSV